VLGDLELNLEKKYIVKQGQLAIINPFSMHSGSLCGKNKISTIYFDGDFIRDFQKDIFNTKEYIPFSKVIIDDKKEYSNFLKLFNILKSDAFCMQKQEAVVLFLTNLMKKYCQIKPVNPKKYLAKDIKDYLDKNFKEPLKLQTVAKEFLITEYHLIRLFKKEFGLTPYQYILNKKINLAKELLAKQEPIAQVAIECGFKDQSHLYKYFKDVFSFSPKEYQDSF